MRKRDPNGDDVASWVKSESVDSICSYLRAGRIHQTLSTDELVKKHIDAIRAATRALGNLKCWQDLSDLSDELAIRDEPAPNHVIAELEKLYTAIEKLAIALSDHPEFGSNLSDKFVCYLSERDKGH
jgi:hypothetical protein